MKMEDKECRKKWKGKECAGGHPGEGAKNSNTEEEDRYE